MKHIKLIIKVATLVFTSVAMAQSAPDTCKRCADMKRLEERFNRLNYSRAADYNQGSELTVQVLRFTTQFKTLKALTPRQRQEFQSLVTLVAAETPYDVETAGAADLAVILRTFPDLKTEYDAALALVAEPCRKQLLSTAVEEHTCVQRERADGRSERESQPSQACEDPKFNFDFDACLAANKKK